MSNKLNRADLEGLKTAYLQHLVLRNLSALSVKQIEQALRIFMGYLKGRGINDAGALDAEVFEQYKAHLADGYVSRRGKPLAVNTIRERLLIAQRWSKWLRKKGVLFFDPLAAVQLPRHRKGFPRGVMRPDEIRKVMELPDLNMPLGYRDRTMMEVLYATGVRCAELLNLRIPDLDWEKKTARVRNGKGGKDRFVPLTSQCCRFLERYLNEIRPQLMEVMRPSGRLWKQKAGTGGDKIFVSLYGGPLSKNWLAMTMKRYIDRAGVTRPVSPVHSFRHSVATHLLEDGMDVRYVQVLLGHESINSTQIYTHVERATLHRLLKEHHPRELARETPQPFKIEEEAHAAA